MKNKIFSLIKVTSLVFLVIFIALVINYAFQYFWISPRYWGGTVTRSNEKVANTTKNFINLYGSEKFAALNPAQIKKDYSALGYNLFLEIRRSNQVVVRTTYAISTILDDPKTHYTIDCAIPGVGESCSILILEDVNSKARDFNANHTNWLKNWFIAPKDNFEDKYNNITWPFFVALSSSSLIATIILGWYFYANKKKRIFREKEEESQKLEEHIIELHQILSNTKEEAETARVELDRLNSDTTTNTQENESEKQRLHERVNELEAEKKEVDEEVLVFIDIRAIERAMRNIIHKKLSQRYPHGNYWDVAIPNDIRERLRDRLTWLKEQDNRKRIDETYFGECRDIIRYNYGLFVGIFGRKDDAMSYFRILINTRNALAHDRENSDLRYIPNAIEWAKRKLEINNDA
ncbi:MAG: hypothetical protein Q7S04_02975 [Candidatus Moranbacteria bacterium]|nr:hypothetical protein [Candidatus Moranbacteria bacterium]